MVKVVLLYLIVTNQLLEYSDAICRRECKSLSDIANEVPCEVRKPGAIVPLYPTESQIFACDNSPYILAYQSHQGGELQSVHQQRHHRGIKTPPIYMNTSGVYCLYKNCTTGAQMDYCCIKATVPTKMRILFSETPQSNTHEYGICIASAWPRPPENNITVSTNNPSCEIRTLSVRYTDTYTTVVYFTVYVNSSCEYITCFAPSKQKQESINTSHFTTTASPTHTQTPPPTPTQTPTPTTEDTTSSTVQNDQHCGGALGIHSITLWTIVFVIFSTVVT